MRGQQTFTSHRERVFARRMQREEWLALFYPVPDIAMHDDADSVIYWIALLVAAGAHLDGGQSDLLRVD